MLGSIPGSAGTFRDVKNEPIHRWFPWIEGFSDELPRLAISREEPASVYDPFLGSGTTALVALQMGIQASGAEVNPFLRFVTRVKTAVAARLASEPRPAVEGRFQQLLEGAESFDANPSLLSSLFADADYFERVALADITRVKGAIDTHAQLGVDRDLALLALARVLVDSSNMIRRADLRRRRANETNGQGKKVLPHFRAAIEMMIDDLDWVDLDAAELGPIWEDARKLPAKDEPTYELCVTSPPYLNGTNYVRNTKIEMWVLDMISRGGELREIRDNAVTAGINNVRLGSLRRTFSDPKISSVLSALDEQSYDRRIPAMVAAYIEDMSLVFRATSMRLKPGSALFLDIGDSKFAGVHVPTDEMLTSVASEVGLDLVESHKIRDRRSNDGSPLLQKLLVFRTPRPRRVRATCDSPERRLKKMVENRPFGKAPFSARNWGHSWHSMCSYQAKLKPSIAHFLVREFSKPGDTVLDPFSGAGTIPLEACLQGRVGWGNDISPLANQLTAAKTVRPDAEVVEAGLAELLAFVASEANSTSLRKIQSWGMNGPMKEYFHEQTLREIVAARSWFLQAPRDSSTALLWAACAHILHGNRPYALSRRSHPITPFAPTGPKPHRQLAPRLTGKVQRLLDCDLGSDWVDGVSTKEDVVNIDPSFRRADVVLTSPPFFGSTRFHTNNWMRMWFCGWEPEDFEVERKQFLEYRQASDFSVYERVLVALHRSLRGDGIVVWHLGKSRKFDMAKALEGLAAPWFLTEGVFEEDVSLCQSHGISDQGTTHTHQFLLMRAR
ncbi:MAG: DNA methyltransferase [Solirubrobacterales bacterium]